MPQAGRAALLVGTIASFLAAVDLVRWIRPLPLSDSDPAWAVPRLLLGLFLICATACAGGLTAGAFFLWSRSSLGSSSLSPLPLRRATLVALTAVALVGGTFLRFVALDRLPPSLWIDDVSLIAPALGLQGAPGDFADMIRPAPFGLAKPYGSVGVLYLELYRAVLRVFGTSVFGVRFLSAAAGVLSLATASLLGRELLPRGGGTLAALVLAGMRWNLILSRWAWVAIVLASVLDLAAILVLRARRRKAPGLALAGGLAAGMGAHIYLSAWVGATALLGLTLWPGTPRGRPPRVRLGVCFVLGFALAVAPLFLFQKDRAASYFARGSDHNLIRELHYARSLMPAFAAAADSLASPWLLGDPASRNDLAGKPRLGLWIGLTVSLAFARCLFSPRDEFSALLLCHAGAALAASVAGGHAGVPNGYRFGYLSDVMAVAAAGGMLSLIALPSPARRRAGALAVVGLVAISGMLSARDALLRWPQLQETFDGFHGADTLIGRAAARWEVFGRVEIEAGLGHSFITIGAVRRYRLDPDRTVLAIAHRQRSFRLMAPGTSLMPGERTVERVRDGWGKEWGIVIGARR